MRNNSLYFGLLFYLMLSPFIVSGHVFTNAKNDSTSHTKIAKWLNNNSGIRFLENKGQMGDRQRGADSSLLFKATGDGVDVYITTAGLSYVFTKLDKHKKIGNLIMPDKFARHHENDSITVEYCRADMELVGADIKKANIIKEGKSNDGTDFYLGGICPNGILDVYSYGKVTIKNIYPGIDWILYQGAKGLEYDFVVHPRADPSIIKLKYKWTDAPVLQEDGSVKVSIPSGNIIEGKPKSWTGNSENVVPVSFNVFKDEISFRLGDYDKNQVLTIDPPLVWATFYAGTMGAQDTYCVNDDGIDVWITGWTASLDFPTYNPGGGAYFMDTLNGVDIFILKFTTGGVLEWATYYGGNTVNFANCIYSDGSNVWLTGYTQSSNFPVLNPGGGAYFQPSLSPGSGQNVFIIQFNTAGKRKWATYYGGNATDFGYAIQSDGTNVWVTGTAWSTNFPIYNPGGNIFFQGTLGGSGSISSPFILQFSNTGVRKWATYYGADGAGYSIQSDGSNVWLTGAANKPCTFPTVNPGNGAYFQTTPGGTSNPFIAKFTTKGVLEWGTYFGGNGSNDIGYSIYSDRKGVWLTGATQSSNFPVLNPGAGAYFQGTPAGAFIARFNTAGALKWSTYYGGNGGDMGTAIESDGKFAWVTGTTTSNNFPTYDPGGGSFYQGSIPGGESVFALQFDTGGVRKWATYYGINQENDWSSITCDGTDVFLSDDAFRGGTYPTVNPGGGAYYHSTIDGGENVFIAKFCVHCDCALNSVYVASSKNSVCRGDTITLTAIPFGTNLVTYKWAPGGQTTASIHITADSINTFAVTVTDTADCSHKETATINIKSPPVTLISGAKAICPGDTINLSATPSDSTTYNWSPSGQTSSSVRVTPVTNTTYTLIETITSSGCSSKDSATILVYNFVSNACCDSTITSGEKVQLTSSGGIKYSWSPSTWLSCDTCPNPIATPNVTTRYYEIITSDSGCTVKDTILITVLTPSEACGNVFIPDVFSPNASYNNILYVRGPCIAAMDFIVFDRWGNKVFESQKLNDGWDGTYKGQAVNMATYIWSLKATLQDGTSIEKKGDVTIVR